MQAIRRLASHCSEALAARFRQGLLPRRQVTCVTHVSPWTNLGPIRSKALTIKPLPKPPFTLG